MISRKNYQRKFNKLVRSVNKNIFNDNIWLGRFIFRQRDACMEKFEDGSGGVLHVDLIAIDKKTGYYKDYIIEYAPYFSSNLAHIWEAMNKFITEDTEVWYQTPSPKDKEFIEDFRNVQIDSEFNQKKAPNYYMNYSNWKKMFSNTQKGE